jgi:hypothetical protein
VARAYVDAVNKAVHQREAAIQHNIAS